jgi:hypothetical protein
MFKNDELIFEIISIIFVIWFSNITNFGIIKVNNVIGKIINYDNYNLSLVGVGIDEVSFDVPKYVNGVKASCWDDLIDLKVIELKKYGRFQIKVSYTDETQTTKSVVGQSLEVELPDISFDIEEFGDIELTLDVFNIITPFLKQ